MNNQITIYKLIDLQKQAFDAFMKEAGIEPVKTLVDRPEMIVHVFAGKDTNTVVRWLIDNGIGMEIQAADD